MKKFFKFRKKSEDSLSDEGVLKRGKSFKEVSLGDISNRRLMVVITVLFVLYVVFSPDSPIVVSVDTKLENISVRNEIERLQDEMKKDCVVIDGIKNNRVYLIKYAREKLYLSNKGEDIYIVD